MPPLASPAAGPDLGLFFLLVAGVILLPGLDMACVAGSALVGGLRAGAAAVAGILVGGLVHVAVAMTGLAAVLAWWPAAFDAVLLAGAAWMTWVGVQIWRSAASSSGPAPTEDGGEPRTPPAVPGRQVFRRALLTCLGNPKAYAFSLAVFPAFVHAGTRPWWLQALLLAGIVAGTQAAVYGTVALVSARGGQRAAASPRAMRRLARGVAGLLVAGAVATVATGWRSAQAQPAAPAMSSSPASSSLSLSSSTSSSSSSTPQEPPAMNAVPHPADLHDGAHDFDFLVGDWQVVNRKRLGILKGDDRWETFEASNHVRALPGGAGNRDVFVPVAWRPGYVGLTFRVYEPNSRTWSLYWVGPHGQGLDPRTGHLLPPVSGRFDGDTGRFEGDDTWEGRPIRVRFTWRRVDASHATWSQAFSDDGGRSWETNWEMAFTRRDPVADVLAVEAALCRAFREADTATLDRLLHPAFTFVNGRGEADDRAGTLAELAEGRVRYERFENRDQQVRLVSEDTAVVTGLTAVAGRAGERSFAADVRFTDTFVRGEDGAWRLAAGQSSSSISR